MDSGAATDLSCRELVELVTDYLEDSLPAHERARFDAHLEACDACRAYVGQIRTTVRLTREAAATQDFPGMEGLLEAFRGYKRRL